MTATAQGQLFINEKIEGEEEAVNTIVIPIGPFEVPQHVLDWLRQKGRTPADYDLSIAFIPKPILHYAVGEVINLDEVCCIDSEEGVIYKHAETPPALVRGPGAEVKIADPPADADSEIGRTIF